MTICVVRMVMVLGMMISLFGTIPVEAKNILSPNFLPSFPSQYFRSPSLDMNINIPIPTRIRYKQFRACLIDGLDKCSAIVEHLKTGKFQLVVDVKCMAMRTKSCYSIFSHIMYQCTLSCTRRYLTNTKLIGLGTKF